MLSEPKLKLGELILALSNAVDLVSPAVADHHMKVAYISRVLSEAAGFSRIDQYTVMLAGALHDIGALSLHERLEALRFELADPHQHAEVGYRLLQDFRPLSKIAEIIRHHHVPWKQGEGRSFRSRKVLSLSHVLHLADRIAVLLRSEDDPLTRGGEILDLIKQRSDDLFNPELVTAFEELSAKEFFWLEAVSPAKSSLMIFSSMDEYMELDSTGLCEFSRLFARIIDFRSRHTATHSSAVAVVGADIARLIGFSEREIADIRVAGYLHDLGKLSVPKEILDKESELTDGEYNIVRRHTFFTHRLLTGIEAFVNIRQWAAFHHERLDGSGYPFRLSAADFPLGARIIAVADIYCALREDRPYRKGYEVGIAIDHLRELARAGSIDTFLVDQIRDNSDTIEVNRDNVYDEAMQSYLHRLGNTVQ